MPLLAGRSRVQQRLPPRQVRTQSCYIKDSSISEGGKKYMLIILDHQLIYQRILSAAVISTHGTVCITNQMKSIGAGHRTKPEQDYTFKCYNSV